MDTNKNSYTIIYATVMVVIVAAVLAFVSSSLKEKQQKNIDIEKQLSLLSAVGLGADANSAPDKTAYVEEEFSKYIKKALVVNGNGDVVSQSENRASDPSAIIKGEAFKIDLKTQYDEMKRILATPGASKELVSSLKLPVFVCDLPNGESVYLFSCYGAGLWGPIWGYIALRSDFNSIYGAIFAHKGETPGLGAEIASPHFYEQFKGKEIFNENTLASVQVVKGGATPGDIHGVDAISGGTITSKALEGTIKSWLEFYVPYLTKIREIAATPMPIEAEVAADSTNVTK